MAVPVSKARNWRHIRRAPEDGEIVAQTLQSEASRALPARNWKQVKWGFANAPSVCVRLSATTGASAALLSPSHKSGEFHRRSRQCRSAIVNG